MKLQDLTIHFDEEVVNEFLLDEYRVFLKTQWLTINTIDFYISYLQRFIRYSKLKELDEFKNFLKIKVAYNKLFDRTLKNNTLDKYRKSLIKYYSFLIDNEMCESNFWRKLLKVKIPKQLPSSLSLEDINTINEFILKDYEIDFYRYRAYMIFNTFLYTGLRKFELILLKKKNIDTKFIKVESWKGQKDRIIYISQKFSKLLQDYLKIQDKNDEYLFCKADWWQLNINWIDWLFKRIKDKTQIKVYPHLLRHTYASMCVKKWINIYTLQQQMGHTDLKTTSVYLYLNSRENWEEVQKLSF